MPIEVRLGAAAVVNTRHARSQACNVIHMSISGAHMHHTEACHLFCAVVGTLRAVGDTYVHVHADVHKLCH